ncbi:MAG: phosphoribosylglycinamide formyltransferase [Kiritimatiellae bacterium]|nr:phosphoribosylglycinamide formyltransferase [Kiritimatiellia bacterium]
MNLAVLGSGSGTNLQCILDAVAVGRLSAKVVCVASDVEGAFILERARRAGVPAAHVDASPFKTKLDGAGEDRMIKLLQSHGTTHVALAGFMRIIKPRFLEAFAGRIVNIHPSLLPAFPGLQAWKQALDYGAKVAGCTVHFVDSGTDTGPIITQRPVPVLDHDTPETLHARIQAQEHEAYPEALQWIAEGRIRIEGRRTIRNGGPSTT